MFKKTHILNSKPSVGVKYGFAGFPPQKSVSAGGKSLMEDVSHWDDTKHHSLKYIRVFTPDAE